MISSTVVGEPIAAGQYLFWIDTRNTRPAVYGYNLTAGTEFLIKDTSVGKASLASDGQTLVWVENAPFNSVLTSSPSGDSIRGYDTTTGQEISIVISGGREFGGLALDNGVLYYQDGSDNHIGLYSRILSTGQENLISAAGQNPVAADGKVVWVEKTQECYPSQPAYSDPGPDAGAAPIITGTLSQSCDSTSHLYLLNTTQPTTSNLPLAIAKGFRGYSVSSNKVVWTQLNEATYLYTISTATTTTIATRSVANPLVKGNTMAWTEAPSGAVDQPNVSGINISDTSSSATSAMVSNSTADVRARAITSSNAVVYTVDNDLTTPEMILYLSDSSQTGLQYDALPNSNSNSNNTLSYFCGGVQPINCGQVYRSGYYLYDNGGRWTANGVAFFLPQRGINAWTLYDNDSPRHHGYYTQELADGSLEYWLGVAQTYVQARTLRVFIDLPDEVGSTHGQASDATSLSALYNFADRANAHGMRLGIVLHNSAYFVAGSADTNWVTAFRQHFSGTTAREIAYVSADNEINVHCTSGYDCFDYDGGYIANANAWVSWVSHQFRDHGSPIKLTVGLTTGLRDYDNLPPGNDFFRTDRGGWHGTPLYQYVDFLSPHNYTNDPYYIEHSIRVRDQVSGTQSAVVLEEYGGFTDNRSQNYDWAEGCFDPYNPGYLNCPGNQLIWPNASFYVETNVRSIRGENGARWAGGVSFMLADMDSKVCTTDTHNPNGLHDLFSGLWAVGGNYCLGTYSTSIQPKAPAFRVRTQHCYYPYGYNNCP